MIFERFYSRGIVVLGSDVVIRDLLRLFAGFLKSDGVLWSIMTSNSLSHVFYDLKAFLGSFLSFYSPSCVFFGFSLSS